MSPSARLLSDLGCGSGALIERLLLESSVRRVLGVDNSPFASYAARRRLDTPRNNGRWTLREGSITDAQKDLPAGHPHHRFEWDRRRFEAWAAGVAVRNGYDVQFESIGPAHAWYGTPTQMAIFRRPVV